MKRVSNMAGTNINMDQIAAKQKIKDALKEALL